MKQIKKIIMIAVLCAAALAAILAAVNALREPGPRFNGNSEKSEQRYLLDFTELNSVQTHAIPLNAGDALQCTWSIERGKVDVLIEGKDGAKLYQGNGIDQASFILIADQSDSYTITVTGQNARGVIDIHRTEATAGQ